MWSCDKCAGGYLWKEGLRNEHRWVEILHKRGGVMSRRGSSSLKQRLPLPPMPTAKELGELERMKQNEVTLKTKIRSLELEVETLKCRLDSLRRAKNTTIVRREREEVRISSPRLGRLRDSIHSLQPQRPNTSALLQSVQSTSPQHIPMHTHPPHMLTPPSLQDDLQDKIDRLMAEMLSLKTSHEKEMEEVREASRREVGKLKKEHGKEVAELREKQERECQFDDLLSELERLRRDNAELAEKLEEMIVANEDLRESNLLMQGKCETLLEDLSVKEAHWSEREEKLQIEIRKQWGERYHEWITKAEKKMEELQQINRMLQGMLQTKKHNPDLQ